MHEYCPASGRYDKNMVIHNNKTIGSWPTLRKAYKTTKQEIVIIIDLTNCTQCSFSTKKKVIFFSDKQLFKINYLWTSKGISIGSTFRGTI